MGYTVSENGSEQVRATLLLPEHDEASQQLPVGCKGEAAVHLATKHVRTDLRHESEEGKLHRLPLSYPGKENLRLSTFPLEACISWSSVKNLLHTRAERS